MPRDLLSDRGDALVNDVHQEIPQGFSDDEAEAMFAPGGNEAPEDEEEERDELDEPAEPAPAPPATPTPPADQGFADETEIEIPGIGNVTFGDLREALESRQEIMELRDRIGELDQQEAALASQTEALDRARQLDAILQNPVLNRAVMEAIDKTVKEHGVTLGQAGIQGASANLTAGQAPELQRFEKLAQTMETFIQQQQTERDVQQAIGELDAVDAELAAQYGDAFNEELVGLIQQEAKRLYQNRKGFTPVEYRLVAENVIARRGLKPAESNGKPKPSTAAARFAQENGKVRLVPGRSGRRSTTSPRQTDPRMMDDASFERWIERSLVEGVEE